jgi:hypothetical protein
VISKSTSLERFKGFFRNEGLEPQLIQMNGNVATVALANGHIDFALNISPVLNGAMQGLEPSSWRRSIRVRYFL